MVFTIEPILVEGSRKISLWKDGWSAFTLDGGRGAQFEHEVLITESGAEVLTVP
jgi:methionyl aminopeptidase